jgi:hypothetical protein
MLPSVIMLDVAFFIVMLSVFMLSVVMLSVVEPLKYIFFDKHSSLFCATIVDAVL